MILKIAQNDNHEKLIINQDRNIIWHHHIYDLEDAMDLTSLTNLVVGCMIIFYTMFHFTNSWWHHQMDTFSAFLAICAGNSQVTGEFPAQRPVTQSFDVFFDLRLNKRLSKQLWGWWFEMLSHPLWRPCNVMTFFNASCYWTSSRTIDITLAPFQSKNHLSRCGILTIKKGLWWEFISYMIQGVSLYWIGVGGSWLNIKMLSHWYGNSHYNMRWAETALSL